MKASVIFTTAWERRMLLGRTRKSSRRKLRRSLATQEWISRVRWHAAHRGATIESGALIALALATLVLVAGLWAVLQ